MTGQGVSPQTDTVLDFLEVVLTCNDALNDARAELCPLKKLVPK